MPRPANKKELLDAAASNYDKLNAMIDTLTDEELNTPFDFSADTKKTEAHWGRDKNLRDILVHLHEWQVLLLQWMEANMNGGNKPFLPAPYTWKTYGAMNMEIWKKHQNTSLEDSKCMLEDSHRKVIALAGQLPDEDLFTKAKFPWTGTTSLGSYFISTTSSHYDWAMKKLKAHKKQLTK